MKKEITTNMFYATLFGILIWLEKEVFTYAWIHGNIPLQSNNTYNLAVWGLSIILSATLAVMIWMLTRQAYTDLPWIKPLFQKIVRFFKVRQAFFDLVFRIVLIWTMVYFILSGIFLELTMRGEIQCYDYNSRLQCYQQIQILEKIFPMISQSSLEWMASYPLGYIVISGAFSIGCFVFGAALFAMMTFNGPQLRVLSRILLLIFVLSWAESMFFLGSSLQGFSGTFQVFLVALSIAIISLTTLLVREYKKIFGKGK